MLLLLLRFVEALVDNCLYVFLPISSCLLSSLLLLLLPLLLLQDLRNLEGGRVPRAVPDFNAPLPRAAVVRAALAKLERRIAQAGREATSARTAVAAAVSNALAHLDGGPGALEGKSRSSKKSGSSSAQVRHWHCNCMLYFYCLWYL
jgi:hypothetical protein